MKRPKLSIVIPTYNRMKYLEACIRSILQANIDVDYEIVVVDGGSIDGTREFLLKQPHTRIVEDSLEGSTKACNKGVRAARGEYICWLNDDLVVLDNSLINMLNFLEKNSDVEIIGAFYFSEGEDNKFDIRYTFGLPDVNFGMARSSIMEMLGYFDESFVRFHSDSDLALRAWEKGLVTVGVSEAKLAHHLLDDSLRKSFVSDASDDYRLFLKKWNYQRIETLILSIDERIIDRYLGDKGWQYFLFKALFLQDKGEEREPNRLMKKVNSLLDKITEFKEAWSLQIAGDLFCESGKFNIAEKFFKLMESLRPISTNIKAESSIRLAAVYSQQQKYTEAEEKLKHALSLDPPDRNIKANILIALGNFYSQQQKYTEAEEKLKETLSLELLDRTTIISIHYAMGSNYEKEGSFDKAKEKFEEVMKYAKDIPSSVYKNKFLGGAHFHLGCIYQKMGEKKKAKQHFKECLKFIPDHRKAKENLESE